MSATEPPPPTITPPNTENIIARVQGILLHPKAEWEKIEPEAATTQGLFTGYAGILAIIPAVAQIIGGLFPICVLGVCIHRNLIAVVVGGVLYYVLSLVGVFVISLVANELAPSFGGQKDPVQAQKLVIYSWTAAWLAGIFAVLPMLSVLSIVGLYSFYLLYLGVTPTMKVPADKSVGYTAVTIVLGIIVYAVVAGLASVVVGSAALFGASTMAANPTITGDIHVGNASVNLGQLNQAAQAAQAASQAIQAQANGQPAPAGSVKAIPADQLKALLPNNISGLPRTDLSSTTGSIAGLSGSNAEATYTAGDKRITLEITDIAGMGAMASLASAFSVESDHETQTGYDRVSRVNGNMTEEEFDRQSNSGKYSVLVASRFVVDAEGSGIAIDDLKSAVNAVGIGRLQGMAHS